MANSNLVLTLRNAETQPALSKAMVVCPDGTVGEVEVLSIRGERARVVFRFPAGYVIDREEIWLNKQKEKAANAEAS